MVDCVLMLNFRNFILKEIIMYNFVSFKKKNKIDGFFFGAVTDNRQERQH